VATDQENWRGAGYALAHEWGHYFYGLYDEYSGNDPCSHTPTNIFALQECDSMPFSIMEIFWRALHNNDYNWLNFGVAANQTRHNVNWRVYQASGWEVLARSPDLDPRDGQRRSITRRTHFPELAAVAPTGDSASSIELPDAKARSALQIIWIPVTSTDHTLKAASVDDYKPTVRLVNENSVRYPEAAVLIATLAKDGGFVAKATVTATITAPDRTSVDVLLRDDGVPPDIEEGDGIYVASWLYLANGLHNVTVEFSNALGNAEVTYKGNHYIPGPGGERYQPPSTPIPEEFTKLVSLGVPVSGFPPILGLPQLPKSLTVDNQNFPGRIDRAGDKETYIFTASQSGQLVVRLTDFDFGMQPHVKIFKGDYPQDLVGDHKFTPVDGNYFFARLTVDEPDTRYLVEVSHIDPNAVTGLFSISVGPALPNQTEQSVKVYIPLIGSRSE
jgi:hypothetical protein